MQVRTSHQWLSSSRANSSDILSRGTDGPAVRITDMFDQCCASPNRIMLTLRYSNLHPRLKADALYGV